MQNQEILNVLAQLINNAGNQNKLQIDTAYSIYINYINVRVKNDTIHFYQNKWKVIKRVLNELGINDTSQINKVVYNRFINVLANYNYSNSTINKCCDLLKSIFKVCNELEYINYNPIAGIKKLKEKKPKINIVKKETKQDIKEYLSKLDRNPLNIRNMCLILILNDTGARLNEVINIQIKDIDLKSNSIYLSETKTNNPRYVFISNTTVKYIEEFLKFHNQKSSYFFITLNGTHLKKQSVYDIIDKIKTDLNIDYSISPHKWRHTLATELCNENIHLNEVMKVLGHTQYSTTERYIHQEQEKIRNDVLRILDKK